MVVHPYHPLLRLPILACLFLLLYVGIFTKRGLLDWRRMVQQDESLTVRIRQLKLEKEKLTRRIEALQSDPIEQQYLIRQTLGYVRGDEIVIEFD